MPTQRTTSGNGSGEATETPPNRAARRSKSTVAGAPVVVALHLRARSRRGLEWDLYSAKCPDCSERRVFLRAGLRRCACGAALNVAIGTEVA